MNKHYVVILISLFLFSSCSIDEDEVYYFYFISRNNDYNEYFKELVSDYADDNDIAIEPLEYFPDELNSILKRDSLAWDIIEFNSSDYVRFIGDSLLNIKDSIEFNNNSGNFNIKFNDFYALPFLYEIPYLYVNKSSTMLKYEFTSLKIIRHYFENPFEYSLKNSKTLTGLPINDKYYSQKYLLTFFNFLSNDSSKVDPSSVHKFLALTNISFVGTQKEVEKAFLNNKLTCIISDERFEHILNSQSKVRFEKMPLINTVNFSLLAESSLLSVRKNLNGNENMVNFLKYLYSKEIQEELNQESSKFATNIYGLNNKNFNKIIPKNRKVGIKLISEISNMSNYDFQNYLIDIIFAKYSAEYFCQKISEKPPIMTQKPKNNTKKHK